MLTIDFTYDPDDPTEDEKLIKLAAKNIICESCEGTGRSSAYLGSFSQDDMDEMDEEWIEDYFAGRFDRHCPECNGDRIVLVVDEEKADPKDLAIYNRIQYEKYQDEQVHRMEMQAEYGYEAYN